MINSGSVNLSMTGLGEWMENRIIWVQRTTYYVLGMEKHVVVRIT